MRARTAVRIMERPFRVTLFMTLSRVSSLYTKSKSYKTKENKNKEKNAMKQRVNKYKGNHKYKCRPF